MIFSRTAGRQASAALTFTAACLLASGCGTRENNGLGIGLIEEQAGTKAVRVASISPPDTSADFQLSLPEGSAGASSVLLLGAESNLFSRALLRFDLAAFPDSGQSATLDSAQVRLFFERSVASLAPLTVTVHRVTSSWTETIASSDSLFPTFDAAVDTVTFNVLAAQDSALFSLTELARFWIDRPDSNFGIALVPDGAAASMHEYTSSEGATPPRLVGHWTQDGADSTASVSPIDDTFFLKSLTGYVPLDQIPGRLAVARGLPARSLLKFPLPDLGPRATVNRAVLTLFADPSQSRLVDFTIGAQRVLDEPWTGLTTSVDTFLEGIVLVDSATDSTEIVVTQLVAKIYEEENHGFLVRAASERVDLDHIVFHAHDSEVVERRPRLTLWYTAGDAPEEAP